MEKGSDYAQYEEHIRVPYIIKEPSWSEKRLNDDNQSVNRGINKNLS